MIRTFFCFVICVFLTGTAYGQFPSYPFNRIDLGTQTDNNKYLIWVDSSAPTYTPAADTNAYVAIDTLSGVWYYYRVDSAKWLSLASGGSGSTELADGVTILGDGSTGNEFRTDTVLIATQSYVDANDDVDDADADPTNELQNWGNLPGIPADIADGDHDTQLSPEQVVGISRDTGFVERIELADTASVLRTYTDQAEADAKAYADANDDVDDADADPTNELQNWGNLPGIPVGFADGIDNEGPGAEGTLYASITGNNDAVVSMASYTDSADVRWHFANDTLLLNTWYMGLDGSDGKAFKWAWNSNDFSSPVLNIETNGNIGVGTTTPVEKLHVDGGNIRVSDGNEGINRIAYDSDGNGTLSWATSSSLGLIENITVGLGLDVTGTSTKDIDLDFGELEAVTTVNGNDEFVMRTRFNNAGSAVATNAQVNVQNLLINTLSGGTDISVSASGTSQVEIDYTGSGGTGDITAVNAGDHLTGGGTSGSVTLNVDEGDVWEALVFENEFSGASNQSLAFSGNDYRILRWTVRGTTGYTIDIPDPDFAPAGAIIEVMIDNTTAGGVTFDCGSGLEIYEYVGGALIETDAVDLSLGFFRFVLMPDPNSSSNVWAIQK